MTTIDRAEFNDRSWKKAVVDVLKRGNNVTLKNLRRDSDLKECEEIGEKYKVKLSLHLDHTVCCFKIVNKNKRNR